MMRFFLLLSLPIIITGCILDSNHDKDPVEQPADPLTKVKYNEYTINALSYEEQPYVEDYIRSTSMEHFDQDSVPMIMWGEKLFYHPVYVSRFGIAFVDGFIRTEDPYYLDLAERIAYRLVENSKLSNDQFLFPYNFDYTYASGDEMKSPWYSGMAQGRILTLFTRLYIVTENQQYLDWAHKTFETFKLFKHPEEAWITYVDKNNYFWVEEYPANKPIHVLNGFVFAAYGLYDYYLVTKNEVALKMLWAAITTVEDHIEQYRNPGGISFYDLKDKHRNINYHGVHIEQMRMLHKITGVQKFKDMAVLMESDHHIEYNW